MKNFKIHWETIVIYICFIIALGALIWPEVMFFGDQSYHTITLLVLCAIVCVLGYRVIKKKHKYNIRSFSEIVDSVLSAGWAKQLLVLACLSVVAFIISWALVESIPREWNAEKGVPDSFWMTVCYFFDPGNLNITNHDSPKLQWAISLIVAMLGMTILTGLFISTFTNIIQQRVDDVEDGNITYKSIRNHSVVIGFSYLSESVIRGLLGENEKERKVILLTNHDMSDVHKALYNLTHNEDHDGQIVVYSGDYRYEENLNRLNLSLAKNIYILGDDEIDSRDFENLACAQKVSKIIDQSKKHDEPIPMYVRMDRMPSFSTLQRLDIQNSYFSENVYFRPFNYYEHWTRLLWVKHNVEICDVTGNKETLRYPSLCFDKDIDTQKYVHLVISGFSQMGMALALHALRGAHFGNYSEKNNLQTQITIIDPQIRELRPLFESQYQHLDQIYDVKIDYREGLFEDFHGEIADWSRDRKQMLTIAICIADADAALSQALNMPLDVYFNPERRSEELPTVLVRQKSLSGIWKMIKERKHVELTDKMNDVKAFRKTTYNKYHNIYPFGMMVSSFYPDELDDLKPCLVHADYEDKWVYGEKPESEKATIDHLYELVKNHQDEQLRTIVEDAKKRWHLQPENVKWANRYQTDNHHILLGYLHDLGIDAVDDISDSDDSAIILCSDIEHRRWVGERVTSGWQQSPISKDGKPMRQDSLLLHYDITKTSCIGAEAAKDRSVVCNVLMLDEIYNYVKGNLK